MRALISGQAGIAVILDGDRAVSIDIGNPHPASRDTYEWPYLLEGADDAYELNDASEQQVVCELDLAWRKDRSLHLALILLDSDMDSETREGSARFLEEFLTDDNILRHILNRLHVAPIPATADLQGAAKMARKRYPKVDAILREISEGQEAIARSRQAWELLPPDLFGSALAKESFGFKATEHGLFAAMSSNRDIELTGFSREDLDVIKRWRREIKSFESSIEARRANAGDNDGPTVDSRLGGKKRPTYRVIALAAAACIVLGVVLTAVFIKAQPVEASSIVRLGISEPGFRVVQAPLLGVQQELYGRTLIPYLLRSASKKTAERLFASGEVDARAGRLENAATAFSESNASFPTIAARLNQAVALLNSSKLAQAEELLKSTLRDAERPGNTLLKAAILTNLGHIYRTQGRFDDADRAYSDALAIDRDNNFKGGEAADLNNLALVLLSRGKPVKAVEGFRQALSVAEEAGVESVAADSHLNIARILSDFARWPEAEQNFRSAGAYYEKQESPLGQANYNLAYGQYKLQLLTAALFDGNVPRPDEISQALLYDNRALALYKSVSSKSGQARALLEIGAGLALLARESEDALHQAQEALRLTEEIGDVPGQAAAFRDIGAWYTDVKSYKLASPNLERALEIARKIGAYGEQCVTLDISAKVMALSGKPDLALQYVNEAVDVSLISGDAFVQASAYDNLGWVLYKVFGRNAEALTALEHAYNLYSEVDSPLRDGTRMLMDSVRNNTPAEDLNRDRSAQPHLPH